MTRYAAFVAAVLILGTLPAGRVPHLNMPTIALGLGLVAWGALLTGVGVLVVRGRQ